MIPAETAQLWTENRCIRKEGLEALDRFINSLLPLSTEISQLWAREFCQRIVDDGAALPVRMPIFQKVIFPALHADLHGSDSRSARYLAGFAQLLYKSPSCMEQLPEEMRSEFGLLLEAVRLDQNDKSTIGRLLSVMRSHFEYALHELPAGVLYAYDGATIEECDLMLTELAHYERLVSNLGGGDEHNEDLNLILELRFHIPAYQRYLSELTNHYDYETFLASQEQSAHETDE